MRRWREPGWTGLFGIGTCSRAGAFAGWTGRRRTFRSSTPKTATRLASQAGSITASLGPQVIRGAGGGQIITTLGSGQRELFEK
jgi:hypothetical protein